MELFKEILTSVLAKEEVNIVFPNIKMNVAEIVDMECYKTLQKIKAVIENDSLSDFDCIEEIVCLLESMGSGGGSRHDFG